MVQTNTAMITAWAEDAADRLISYCARSDWKGYDPYDALNSRLYRALPLLNFKVARLALTQGVKRCPLNIRPALLVPKSLSPKGAALFLSAFVKLSTIDRLPDPRMIPSLAERIVAMRSPGIRHYLWGYDFDWQTRTRLIPKGTPNIICSTFAANALLDADAQRPEPRFLGAAISTADFIRDRLFWRGKNGLAGFSYSPVERTLVHNANFLGAAFLIRVADLSGESRFIEPALEVARYSLSRQHPDGAWDYGDATFQRWIDNFHTGFNLVALKRISALSSGREFESAIDRGLDFFRERFFREDGAPRYFHDATYPIDIHSVAQSLITLMELKGHSDRNINLAHTVMRWARAHMWDDRGYFYYQKSPLYTRHVSFMRWSQGWMLLALATFLFESRRDDSLARSQGGR
jgi:hypothetical protein